MQYDFPHGYVLSESALYAFVCQDVYLDVLSFAAAIPDHLKPLFLIPIQVQFQSASSHIASRLARRRFADSIPSGSTDESDMFDAKTFVTDDTESTVPGSEPGSIFQMDDAQGLTHHQEDNYDENIQVPSETSYMSDVFPEDSGADYPYTPGAKITKSSRRVPFVALLKLRVALKPDQLENHAPPKIRNNAKACTVSLVSYDKQSRVFTFSVDCGNGAKQVQSKLSDIDQVSMSCNCPFWRWNGPEFHAKENSFMLGQPFGTAETPDVRDPDRKYWMCKHAYAVLRRLDNFVQEVVDENWDKDEDELLDVVDEEWDRLEGAAAVPLEETEEDDIDIDIDWDGEDPDLEEAEEGEDPESEDDGSIDVDLSELEPDYETPSGGPESEPPPPSAEDEEPDYQIDVEEGEPEEDYEVDSEEEAEEDYEAEEAEAEEDYETSEDEDPKSKK